MVCEFNIYDARGNQVLPLTKISKDELDRCLEKNKDNIKLLDNWDTKYNKETLTAYKYKILNGANKDKIVYVWITKEVR